MSYGAWESAKVIKAMLPSTDHTEDDVQRWAKWNVRFFAELAIETLVNDYANGWEFFKNLDEPKEGNFNVSVDDTPMIARLWMAEQYLDNQEAMLSEDGGYTLSWVYGESLKGALTGKACEYVDWHIVMEHQALAESLRDELVSLGGNPNEVKVSRTDPWAHRLGQGIDYKEHALGSIAYYPFDTGEVMVIHVDQWDFFIVFQCQHCAGFPPCGHCHDMSGAERDA